MDLIWVLFYLVFVQKNQALSSLSKTVNFCIMSIKRYPKIGRNTRQEWSGERLLLMTRKEASCQKDFCLRVSIAVKDTLTTATVIRKTFNWGWPTVSEVQFTIIMTVSMAAYKQMWCGRNSFESYILQATGSQQTEWAVS